MPSLRSLPRREAGFIEPMECLAVPKLPDSRDWVYEVKLDGYRAIAINSDGKLSLYSRRRKSFHRQYQHVFEALHDLPEDTVVDGEIVALDDAGRPNFNLLQHSRGHASRIHYYVFDLLIYGKRDLMKSPLVERRAILLSMKFKSPRIRISEYFETSLAPMLQSAREEGFEGSLRSGRTADMSPGKEPVLGLSSDSIAGKS